jgi:lipopolysaccharide export system protein LptA
VVVAEGEAQLRAGLLALTLEEPAHELRWAKAEDRVVIERGDQQMTCGQAIYDATTSSLALSGGTTWRVGQREGSSDALSAELAARRYLARGQVRMRFAEGTWPQGGPLFGAGRQVTTAPPAADQTQLVGPVEVTADEFEYRASATAGADEWAIYRGGVAVAETNRMQLTCAALTAQLTAGTNHLRGLDAEGGVEIRVTEPAGYRLARGDRATYDGTRNEVKLTGPAGVDFFIATPEGVSRGRGREAAYLGGSETLELAGEAHITTPEGELSGRRVSLDRAHHSLSAAGRWQIRIPLGELRLPELPLPATPTKGP